MIEMSSSVLLILTLGIFKNEITCATLGGNLRFEERISPRAAGQSSSQHWTRIDSKFPLGKNVVATINATSSRFDRDPIEQQNRRAKFLPKFSILAGLNIGDAAAPRPMGNLTPIAKIIQANTAPGSLNPYFAATYDPYPSAGAMQQSIQTLYRIVERLSLQVDHFNKHRADSDTGSNALFTSANVNDVIDDKKRNKNKLKKTNSKRKKPEDVRVEAEEEEYNDDKTKKEKFSMRKTGSKNGARKQSHAKQTITMRPNSSEDTSIEVEMGSMETTNAMGSTTSRPMNSTSLNETTEQGNTTYPPATGYYYGGPDQSIGNVGFTYDKPHEANGFTSDNYVPSNAGSVTPSYNYGPPSSIYGAPPSYNYGSPSFSYGAPSYSYGTPSYAYGPPSRGYGPPSQTYQIGPYASIHDNEPVVYEDPNVNSFAPITSEQWPQRLPFARSRKIVATTATPAIIANGNGFVPI